MFSAAVGNPPYQFQTGKNTSVDIYPDFQKSVSSFSLWNSLVYPAAWQKDVSEKDEFLGRFLIDNGAYTVYSYVGSQLFGSHIERGFALSIVACNYGYNEDIETGDEPLSRPVDVWNTRKDTQILLQRTKRAQKYLSGLVKDVAVYSNLKDANVDYSANKKGTYKYPILVKREPGVGSKAEWFYVSENDYKNSLKKGYSETGSYKVIMQSAPLGRLSQWKGRVEARETIRAFTIEPGASFGKTFVLLGEFSTSKEAENFENYVNSKFFLRLAALDIRKAGFGRFVPDLQDYSDNNSVFTDKSNTIDENLLNLFGLTDREKQYF